VQPFPNSSSLADTAFLDASREILYLNSSRNPAIDEVVRPGPYKEILPCLDMCYNLVQSCPAAMGFECPGPGNGGFASSYGMRPDGSSSEEGQITCNYPGAAYHLSGAGVVRVGWLGVLVGVVVVGMVVV
jgi:calcium channel MID1